MNFSNQFADVWGSRFPGGVPPPQLDCLKADQFGSLSEQKHALEFEESKRSVLIEELRQQLNHELFVVEFLHKCIQKLGAVSQVFSEIDQSDSKSSSSSGTTGRCPGSGSSPPLSLNGSVFPCTKLLPSTKNSTFPLFSHCIASNLMHSASPLLAAAAAATPSSSLLLSSALPVFAGADSMKVDPDPEPANGVSASNFLFSTANHSSYDAISRLTASSPFYNNPFSNTPTFPSYSARSQSTSLDSRSKDDSGNGPVIEHTLPITSSSEAHAQAAAAVAAAFGLGLHTVRTSRCTAPSQVGNLDRPDLQNSNGNLSFQSTSRHHSPNAVGINGKDNLLDSSLERPYQCTTCSRSFAVKAGLVQHMRTHTDERPYPCLHCGRAFKQKIQLTTHMRVHSGERPYGCRLCGKLFRQQSHVVQHLRTHTGEKPHKCYQCGKAFRQKYSLISHQRRMCRNRTASNPIAAGMTMWISPGVGGDTCNLVKEFSPARTTAHNVAASLASPHPSVSTPISISTSGRSPFSPYRTSSPGATSSSVSQLTHFPNFVNHRHVEETHLQGQKSQPIFTSVSVSLANPRSHMSLAARQNSEICEPNIPKANHSENHIGLDVECGEEDEEEEDDDETDVSSSRSSRLSSTHNTATLGLS